jgi:hypothetical protein
MEAPAMTISTIKKELKRRIEVLSQSFDDYPHEQCNKEQVQSDLCLLAAIEALAEIRNLASANYACYYRAGEAFQQIISTWEDNK